MTAAEAGPWLGRLVAPPDPGAPVEALLSPVRLELLTAVFESRQWLSAWEAAVQGAVAAVSGEIEALIREAARVSRYPRRKIRKELPGSEEREILAARFSAAGIGLETAVRRGESPAGPVRSGDAELRVLCGELEAAWDGLIRIAAEELARARATAVRIMAWKRPLAPVLAGGALLLGAAIWAGLVLGGYVESPGWFRPVAEWVWNW